MVGRKVRSWRSRLAVILVVIGFQVVSSSRHSFAATVAELVKQAKKEGALNAMVITAITGKTTPQLATAFKKRFGLDIDVTLTPLLNTTEYPKAVAETKAGVVPTYDVLEGSDTNNIALLGVGGIHRVDGWENLLREINLLGLTYATWPGEVCIEAELRACRAVEASRRSRRSLMAASGIVCYGTLFTPCKSPTRYHIISAARQLLHSPKAFESPKAGSCPTCLTK